MSTGASLRAALELHEQGINVLRAPRQTKAPTGQWKQWTTERLTSREVAEAFANGRGDDNLYVITGSVSGLCVLDCDDEVALRYWQATVGLPLDRTAAVKTGNGWHFYFRLDAGQVIRGRGSTGGESGKWDFRAEGGGVIAPPSLHASGRRYEWMDGRTLANLQPAPAALLDSVRKASSGPNAGLNGARPAGGPDWDPLDREEVFRGVAAGRRDAIAYRFACSLRSDKGCSEADALAAMEQAWRRMEQPPGDEFTLDQALEKVRRVYREKPAGRSPEFQAASEDGDKKPAVATQLVQMAEATHGFVQSEEGESYAVALDGPRIALPLRGNQSFRRVLAAAYFDRTGKAASSSAVADALGVLEGRAQAAPHERVYVRVASTQPGEVTLDLGDHSGRAVVATGEGWAVTDARGALFRRTALTSPILAPARGGSLDGMRALLNIGDESWDLLVGYMVAAWIPEIPHPVLWLTGEQGTGKTSALRMIGSLLDPSPAQTRTPPRDIGEWVVTLSGSWVVPVDNVSRITDWLSDAMCRAATGDGLARRQLYGDNDLVVNKLRNVVMLNGIGVSALRGDLGDRLVPIELARISGARRRAESTLRDEWEALRPGLVGALLDLLVGTLAALPDVRLDTLPRMADFAQVLAAVDAVRGTDALGTYLRSRETISEQVVEGDSVAAAIRTLAQRATQATTDGPAVWTGTATDLLRELEDITPREHREKEWPTNAQVLSSRLQRVAPDLAKRGVQVERSRSKKQARTWSVWLSPEEAS